MRGTISGLLGPLMESYTLVPRWDQILTEYCDNKGSLQSTGLLVVYWDLLLKVIVTIIIISRYSYTYLLIIKNVWEEEEENWDV